MVLCLSIAVATPELLTCVSRRLGVEVSKMVSLADFGLFLQEPFSPEKFASYCWKVVNANFASMCLLFVPRGRHGTKAMFRKTKTANLAE